MNFGLKAVGQRAAKRESAPMAAGLTALSKDCCAVEHPKPAVMLVTGSMDGHQHGLVLRMGHSSWEPANGGHTDPATSEGSEQSHSHVWTWTPDGQIAIAESAGHTHQVDSMAVGRLLMAMAGRE